MSDTTMPEPGDTAWEPDPFVLANEINEIFLGHVSNDRDDADTYAKFRNTVESWRLLAETNGYDFSEADLLKTMSVLGYRLARMQMQNAELHADPDYGTENK